MGKLKGKKIPRKLKKEFWKIESWQIQAPAFRSGFIKDPYGRGDSHCSFGSFFARETLKLKDGVKVNKWTRRLIRRLYNEKLKGHRYFAEKIMKNDWSHPNFPDEYYQKMVRSKTSEEFRREYLNEPIPENNAVFKGLPELGKYSKVRQSDNGLKPGFIIIDDMDDSIPNFRTKQEEMEWIERKKLASKKYFDSIKVSGKYTEDKAELLKMFYVMRSYDKKIQKILKEAVHIENRPILKAVARILQIFLNRFQKYLGEEQINLIK